MAVDNDGQDLTLCLFGPFRAMLGGEGDVTPKSAKAQALLALLATAPGYSRPRGFLQEKLWSDRAQGQAAASLRQALSELRRTIPDHADYLTITRKAVALNPERVATDLDTEVDGRQEFLEGCEVRDPAFQAWLREQRSMVTPGTPHASALTVMLPAKATAEAPKAVVIDIEAGNTAVSEILVQIFSDAVEKSVCDHQAIPFYRGSAPAGIEALVMPLHAEVVGNTAWLRAGLQDHRTGRSYWSGKVTEVLRGAPPGESPDISRMVLDTAAAVVEHANPPISAHKEPDTPHALARSALHKIFSFDLATQLSADADLERAFEMDGSAVHLGWRVFLRMILNVECSQPMGPDEIEEVDAMLDKALALEPHNSLVLAAAAQSHLKIKNSLLSGYEYARRAVSLNPHSPIALDAMVSANIFLHKFEEAHRLALKARHITANSPYRYWWEMACALTATVTGRLNEALLHAETTHQLNENFRPPLRYLAALSAQRGNVPRARYALKRLSEVEDGFSPQRMLTDETYPVAALRRSDLLRQDLFAQIA